MDGKGRSFGSQVMHAAAAIGLTLLSGGAHAVTSSGGAAATIVSSIDVEPLQSLHFGRILQPSIGGQINVQPGGVISPIANLTLIDLGAPQPGTFLVTGTPNSVFTIALPLSLNLSRIGGGAPAMSVSFISSLPTPTGQLDGTGEETVAVGGNLAVNANQAPGLYEGTYTITVEYQ